MQAREKMGSTDSAGSHDSGESPFSPLEQVIYTIRLFIILDQIFC